MQGPGRPDIVNLGVRGEMDIVNAGSGETRYSECRVWGDQNIVNAGYLGRPRYSECRDPGESRY
ncbi:unnamed protein product [Staurois parvus]|uniref:Uncharacterized protein n=1 Tax=Staurois parvus TaxID=386267 RepID=A0ABN9B639_9NEOB|nr:unnamed protein product [Staurois parvus]